MLTLGFAVIAMLDRWRVTGPTPFLAELAAFFGVISLWISFGNWIDRRTSVEVSGGVLRYRSPMRILSMQWDSVDQLWAIPSGSSWRIVIHGHGARFGFRTAAELRLGKRSLQIGYHEGEHLAWLIRRRSGLGPPAKENGGWVCSRKGDNPG